MAYNLTIKAYLPFYVDFPPEKNLTFDGEVEISMVALEPIERIVLNMKNITIIPEKCRVTFVSFLISSLASAPSAYYDVFRKAKPGCNPSNLHFHVVQGLCLSLRLDECASASALPGGCDKII